MLGGKCRITIYAPLDFERGRRIELAVDQCLEQQPQVLGVRRRFIVVFHCPFPNSRISVPRPRARRDITVPIGISSICAISR